MGFNALGYISSALLALCGLPLLIDIIQTGQYNQSKLFLILWWLGELTGCLYVLYIKDKRLLLNYGWNLLVTTAIMLYVFIF